MSFNNRKRSKQKGPPFRQIYVPHDQRLLNYKPIPITNEFQAQYYLEQLKNMGYVRNQFPQVVSVHITNTDNFISFDLNPQTQGFANTNVDSDRCYLTDIQNHPLQISQEIQNKILNQQGYRLYPIIVTGSIGFRNGSSSTKTYYGRDMDVGTSTGYPVPANTYDSIVSTHPYFTQAYCMASGNNMMLTLYSDNTEVNRYDMFYASKQSFYIWCKTVTCLVFQ